MSVINTNVSATLTSNALAKNDRAMSQSMERLSTGQRINSASDDAAGLAIASKMTSQIRGLDQAVRNGNDAISMIQTADGAMVEVSNMLQRMREIAVQGASDTNTATDRDALDIEFQSLEDQIQAISENTQWNGTNILDGQLGQVDFQIGANASQTISVTFEDLNTAYNSSASATKSLAGVFTTLEGSTASKDLETLDLQNKANASAAITQVDKALEKINAHRATLGSTINRIEYAVDNLANVSQNASASRSRVQDANYATESTELARTQIIQQAGTAMLAQANQQSQSVLALLK
ncbi:flagellin [Porticoccaceae bacterium]|jgi:flagellin|nr:flagellin [Porticoccaceae bacterium]